jgi:hypothetical protein
LTQSGFISHAITIKPQRKKCLHVVSILTISGQCKRT